MLWLLRRRISCLVYKPRVAGSVSLLLCYRPSSEVHPNSKTRGLVAEPFIQSVSQSMSGSLTLVYPLPGNVFEALKGKMT